MNKIIASGVLILVILMAWSPWLTADKASALATQWHNSDASRIQDGPGPVKKVSDANRVLFGFNIKIEYGCGGYRLPMEPRLEEERMCTQEVYVNSFGKVHE